MKLFKTALLVLGFSLSSLASAATTAWIDFAVGSYYSEGKIRVDGEIVRGEWVEIQYPKERMESTILGKIYGGFHCYGYGPSCDVEVEWVETYYRFGYEGEFAKARGPFIYIPHDAAKLEVYFKSPESKVHLRHNGNYELRYLGDEYDSRRGKNYSFYF